MRKPTFCICGNKDADQICGNITKLHRRGLLYIRDVNEYSNVRIFAFHTNILMRFLDSTIRIIF